MTARARQLAATVRSTQGRTAGRYLILSCGNFVLGEALLAFLFGVAHLNARDANLLAVAIGTGPAYYLARRWVWKRRGRSHLLKEVVPFWALSAASVVLSTVAASQAERISRSITASRSVQTLFVVAATAVAYGSIFVVRFLAFNRLFREERAS